MICAHGDRIVDENPGAALIHAWTKGVLPSKSGWKGCAKLNFMVSVKSQLFYSFYLPIWINPGHLNYLNTYDTHIGILFAWNNDGFIQIPISTYTSGYFKFARSLVFVDIFQEN